LGLNQDALEAPQVRAAGAGWATCAPALNDLPAGLAAWIVDKFRSWSDCDGDLERRVTRDEILTAISLYWFTRSMPSVIRIYWEGRQRPLKFSAGERVSVSVAVAHFRREIPIPPGSYVVVVGICVDSDKFIIRIRKSSPSLSRLCGAS
jgi:hypothetical protein